MWGRAATPGGKSVLGRGTDMCKGPEGGVCLACTRNRLAVGGEWLEMK